MKFAHNASYTLLLGLMILVLASCRDKQKEVVTYTANVPVYTDIEGFRSSINAEPAKSLTETGKLYLWSDYIFINRPYEGVHIIDNSEPSAPRNIAFLPIPGNVDVAVKAGNLYADSYVDLLVFDLSDVNKPVLIKRLEEVYPTALPPTKNEYPIAQVDREQGVVTGWTVEVVTEEREPNAAPAGPLWENADVTFTSAEVNTAAASPSATAGTSGSMARMAIYNDHLYSVSEEHLQVFDITSPANPIEGKRIELRSSGVETIFPFNDHLLLGTTTGMLVYALPDPAHPGYISTMWHVRSCDPVVAEGDWAYVTLRGNGRCGTSPSSLDVIDISNMQSPRLQYSFTMEEPYGLGIDDGTLFVCDGNAGLKVYDATDPSAITNNMLAHFSNINTFDVIPHNNLLLMIGADGLYQYDYSDPTNLLLLSSIPTN